MSGGPASKNGRAGGFHDHSMRRNILFAGLLFSVISAVGCVAEDPPTPRAPSVVHVPLGWIGRHSKNAPSSTAAESDAEDESSEQPSEVATTEGAASTPASATTSAAEVTLVPLDAGKPKSSLLPSGFANPLPNGVFAGYAGDTGLDVASKPHEVYAIAAGTLEYSEEGHTLWLGPKDTHFSVRIALDQPIAWKSHFITHVYYTHLSAVEVVQHEGDPLRHHVEAGDAIGVSGIANGLPHLHLGLLLDGHVEQDDWTYILTESQIRAVLGNWANGNHLPGS